MTNVAYERHGRLIHGEHKVGEAIVVIIGVHGFLSILSIRSLHRGPRPDMKVGITRQDLPLIGREEGLVASSGESLVSHSLVGDNTNVVGDHTIVGGRNVGRSAGRKGGSV